MNKLRHLVPKGINDFTSKVKLFLALLAIGTTSIAIGVNLETTTTSPTALLQANADCCDVGDGKAIELILQYTGGSCSGSFTSQQDDKWDCQDSGGGLGNNGSVYIQTNDDFSGTVSLGDVFSATNSGDRLSNPLELEIYSSQGGQLLQYLEIHTSCSAPLVAGDQFGGLILQGVKLDDGTLCTNIPPVNEECPTPVINQPDGPLCPDEAVVFTAPDLEFPCLEYEWDFGADATPSTAVGIGPHSVVFSTTGSRDVSLSVANNCDEFSNNSGNNSNTTDCCDVNDGKPNSLTLEYTGGSCSNSFTSQQDGKWDCQDSGGGLGNNGSVYIQTNDDFSGTVSLGEVFSVTNSGDNLSNPVELEIYSSQGGQLLQYLEIHTSCSAPLVTGDQFGSLGLRGVGFDSGDNCGSIQSEPTGAVCPQIVTNPNSNGADCCDVGDGKAKTVILTYNGGSCGDSDTSQDSGKWGCDDDNGGPNGDPTVYIIASENEDGGGKIYFSGEVNINETFTASASNAGDNEFKSRTYFTIYSSQGGTVLQNVNIHTSCSAPLIAGDQFGSLILEGIELSDGTNCNNLPVFEPCKSCDETTTIIVDVVDCNTASLGDLVFEDLNKDGIQDENEPGVENVTVQLKDCENNILETTTTDENGLYQFDALRPDCYRIGVVLPDGFEFTTPNGGDDTIDSDISPGTAMSENIELDLGENDPTNDAGIFLSDPEDGSIGDLVFEDLDKDGIQDTDEPGIDNVVVKLLDANGDLLQSTVTSNGGAYLFDNLPAGTYQVMVNTPAEYSITSQDAGSDDNLDSDIDGNGMTGPIELGISEDIEDVDAGLFLPDPEDGSIGDLVFEDLDKDGIQDTDEPGIDNVVVKLLDANGDLLQSTVTSNGGAYLFDNLPAGTYQVMVNTPAEYSITSQDAGSDDNLDSDINGNGMTGPIELGISEDIEDVDAGLFLRDPGSIGDLVFEDLDKDGIQDTDEPGIDNVVVKLLDANGDLLQSTVTSNGGAYLFDNLPAGTYQVMVNTPAEYSITSQDAGSDDNLDSDIDGNGMTGPIELGISEDIEDVDAGLFLTDPANGSIGDLVFEDLDKDGIQDTDEPGIDDVVVKLLDANGDLLQSTVTSNGGAYLFDNLPAGTYQVMVNTPAEYSITSQDAGSDDNLDSDIDENGMTEPIELGISEDIEDVDAGLFLTDPANGSIGDLVFEDLDKDGIQDTDEPGIDNVVVKLLDANGDLLQSTVTSNGGAYLFDNLPAGTYQVMVNTPAEYSITSQDAGSDDNLDSDIDGNGMTGPIELGISEDIEDVDAGLFLTDPANGSIGDLVFEDLDKDGIQDTDEPGIDDVVVKLLDANGDLLQSTVTSNGGAYLFDNLPAGTYQVMVNTPAEYSITSQDAGSDDNLDSDIDGNGMTEPIELGISEDIEDVDAGLFLTDPANGSIGDLVFEDLDKDGIQDTDEPGIDNVVVKLLDANGDLLQSTVTSNGGAYLFDNLPAGTYQVMVNTPAEYSITSQDAGSDDNLDSDIDENGMTEPIELGISEDIEDVDAGLFLPESKNAVIEGTVFIDEDKDGIQDPTEEGSPNVPVTLLDENGDVVDTTTTDENGDYIFTDLPEGIYTVVVDTPVGQEVSPQDQGTDDTIDSDVDMNGTSDPIEVDPSEVADVDAGISPIDPKDAAIGNRVFEDLDKDGIQDSNELGVAGIDVKLLDENADVVATTTTSEGGWYIFQNLSAGTYQVMFTIPTDYTISPQDQGTDEYKDSDIDANGMTTPVTVAASETIYTEDAGIYLTDPKDAAIGNRVFEDLNQNGVQDADEPGVAGITVILLDNNGTTIATDVTGTGGWYQFPNLAAGDYVVVFDLPTDYVASPQGQGTDIYKDSDIDAAGRTTTITLAESENNITVDAGIYDNSTPPSDPKKIYLEAECGDLGADWVVGNDANASNGDYITRPEGDAYAPPTFSTSPAIATYSFDIEMADTYKIWGRVLTPNGLDDSFWVQVDNGAWIKWNGIPYNNEWQWDDVHNADNSYQMELFELAQGTHTLRIAYREDGAQLDKILIATQGVIPTGEGETAGNCDETPASNDVCLEAECGDLGADWMTIQEISASNGLYIQNEAPSNYNTPSSTDQVAAYDFALSETGTYFVWARVQTAGSTGDSFWVRVDGGDWINWNGIKGAAGWTWAKVRDASNGYQIVGFDLDAGNHTIEFAYREQGVILDKICINQNDKMSEIEPVAYNCGEQINATTSFSVADTNTEVANENRSTENMMTITANDISAYPNPTSGLLNLNIDNLMGKNVLLTVNTVTGQELLRQQLNTENSTAQLDLSSYQDGVYTLFFHVDIEGVISEKIVILK